MILGSRKFFGILLFLAILVFWSAPAAAADAGFAPTAGMWFSPNEFFSGTNVKIHAIVFNNKYSTLYATVEFYNNETLIGTRSVENVISEEARQVSINWLSLFGEQKFTAKLTGIRASKDGELKEVSPQELGSAAEVTAQRFVDNDTDGDAIGDREDDDDDNDGLSDAQESTFGSNKRSKDTDQDGLTDFEESQRGTDLTLKDSDRDGVDDINDKYPMNPLKSSDEPEKSLDVIQEPVVEKVAEKVAEVVEVAEKVKASEEELQEVVLQEEEPQQQEEDFKTVVKEFGGERDEGKSFLAVYILFAALVSLAFSIAFTILAFKSKKE